MPWHHPFWMQATQPWTRQTCQTPAPGCCWGTSHWGPAVLAGGKTPPTWGTASWSPHSRTCDPAVNNGINHEQRLRISYGHRKSTGIIPFATSCTSTALSSCQTLQAQSCIAVHGSKRTNHCSHSSVTGYITRTTKIYTIPVDFMPLLYMCGTRVFLWME